MTDRPTRDLEPVAEAMRRILEDGLQTKGRVAPRPCGHCGRTMGDYAGGYASVGDVAVCHPNEPGRPDCYHFVTVYRHPLRDCPKCAQTSKEMPMEPDHSETAMELVMPFIVCASKGGPYEDKSFVAGAGLPSGFFIACSTGWRRRPPNS